MSAPKRKDNIKPQNYVFHVFQISRSNSNSAIKTKIV